MRKFIELLERKIDGCDALGGLEREKAVYQSVLKDYKKQLTSTDVSQRRELLKKWWKYFDEESVAINCNDEEREEVITNFFNRA